MTWLAQGKLFGPLTSVTLLTCEKCLAGKSARKPFIKAKRASALIDLIHFDICGPFNVKAQNGCSYYITFIDNYSRGYDHVYLISLKFEVLRCIQRYLIEVENRLSKSVKTLRTHYGREYMSDQFKELCEQKGIIR